MYVLPVSLLILYKFITPNANAYTRKAYENNSSIQMLFIEMDCSHSRNGSTLEINSTAHVKHTHTHTHTKKHILYFSHAAQRIGGRAKPIKSRPLQLMSPGLIRGAHKSAIDDYIIDRASLPRLYGGPILRGESRAPRDFRAARTKAVSARARGLARYIRTRPTRIIPREGRWARAARESRPIFAGPILN